MALLLTFARLSVCVWDDPQGVPNREFLVFLGGRGGDPQGAAMREGWLVASHAKHLYGRCQGLSVCRSERFWVCRSVQGYLAEKKQRPPRTLQ